ncbi:hypothetical protein C6A77_14815 [Pseudomonas sp. AFG_SD02_1510_Pfu_092]|uniref:hypothetical protein n=1 Tax=Pseudomonas sp. AFG_SD02_1510_Pfu_092 TaxID=2259497 RepID=UPI000DF01155|nr:hypothetical protein [Pseudomonas sp. AFG_SD02_1510_Pfu_092]RCL25182.1 hypothetical protein C6A77_14815 [Pseudomonas sp. AFG_SD02_1510_Pfu_092]
MHTYHIRYQLNGQPSSHSFELKQPNLALHEAALHLLLLHFGDGENKLLMPPADASPQEVLAQAETLGLSQIEVA